jgi:6-phosphogluconolactonase
MPPPSEIIVAENDLQLAQRGAHLFAAAAAKAVTVSGCFSVAISGGSTPRRMHRLLSEEPFVSEIPWEKTHIFWIDDRCVPQSDPASNYRAAQADFICRVPLPEGNAHPMPVNMPPERGAKSYQQELIHFFQLSQGAFPTFDLIYLGLGEDGHIASLFPGQDALDEKNELVLAVKGGWPFLYRLTLTLPVLNHGRQVVFLVSGKKKASVVKQVLNQNLVCLPAARVQPVNGNLIWMLDREAAFGG